MSFSHSDSKAAPEFESIFLASIDFDGCAIHPKCMETYYVHGCHFEFRLQKPEVSADSRQQTADSRQQTADSKDSKDSQSDKPLKPFGYYIYPVAEDKFEITYVQSNGRHIAIEEKEIFNTDLQKKILGHFKSSKEKIKNKEDQENAQVTALREQLSKLEEEIKKESSVKNNKQILLLKKSQEKQKQRLMQNIWILEHQTENHLIPGKFLERDISAALVSYHSQYQSAELASYQNPILSSNKFLLHHMSEAANSHVKSIVMVGSNRQSFDIDSLNSQQNRTHSCFQEIPNVATEIKAEFDPYLIADTIGNLSPGTSFKNAIKALEKSDEKIIHANTIQDSSKISLLYAQTHRVSLAHLDKKITLHFYDDRYDILAYLLDCFENNPQLIPANVTLKLFHYDGSAVPLEITAIKGAIETADPHYANRLKIINHFLPQHSDLVCLDTVCVNTTEADRQSAALIEKLLMPYPVLKAQLHGAEYFSAVSALYQIMDGLPVGKIKTQAEIILNAIDHALDTELKTPAMLQKAIHALDMTARVIVNGAISQDHANLISAAQDLQGQPARLLKIAGAAMMVLGGLIAVAGVAMVVTATVPTFGAGLLAGKNITLGGVGLFTVGCGLFAGGKRKETKVSRIVSDAAHEIKRVQATIPKVL